MRLPEQPECIDQSCPPAPRCGDGVRQGAERCDGADLASSRCVTFNYDGGDLACAGDCASFDTSGCTTSAVCADGVRSGPEVCDGADLSGASCASLGFVAGTLACSSDCLAYVTSGCEACVGASCLPPDETLFQTALASYNAGDCATAVVGFDQLWAGYPSSARHDNVGYLRGRCRYELLDYAGAIAAFEQFLAVYPTSLFVHSAQYFTGRSWFALLDYTAAAAAYRAALAANPLGLYADNAQYYLGRSYYEAALFADAQRELALFESTYPASSYLDNARYYLGRSYFDALLFTESIAPFERVTLTAASPFADNATYYRARAHYQLLNFGAVINVLSTFESSFPGSSFLDGALYYLGRAQFETADFTSAIASFGRVAQMGTVFSDNAQYYLGRSRYALADLPGALADFELVVSNFAASAWADNALYYVIRIYVDQASCIAARDTETRLVTGYPASPEIPVAQQYLANGGC